LKHLTPKYGEKTHSERGTMGVEIASVLPASSAKRDKNKVNRVPMLFSPGLPSNVGF